MPESINPATEETIATYDKMETAAIEAILDKCEDSAAAWGRVPVGDRARKAASLAEVLEGRCDELSLLITREMGKPIKQSRSEIEKCAWVCRTYAEQGPGFLADESFSTDFTRSFASFKPLGVILAVMPWNFPFWQVFRFLAPALTAGNGGVLKHASNVTGCALAIEELVAEAGYPENLFRTVVCGAEDVQQMIQGPVIRAVTLTGSEGAGGAVAEAAGRAIKKTVLELGGSDPYIVLEDADLAHAASTCAQSRLINSGQSCIAAKRFIVAESVREEFTELFTREMKAAEPGDPEDSDTACGPLARKDLRDEVHSQVEKSVAAGARLLLGGQLPDRKGYYYPPTVLDQVSPDAPIYREEVFGPVAAIISADSEKEAIAVANDSKFGLGSAVFTRDTRRGLEVARQLESGACSINDFVKSDPRLPFGGIKKSGYGRELSHYGIREFVNIQTVTVK